MTTLRDLSYMIEANTQGLHTAIPAIEKLVEKIDNLTKSIETVGKVFESHFSKIGNAASAEASRITKASNTISSSIDKASKDTEDAAKRTEAALLRASKKVTDLGNEIKNAGAPTKLLTQTTKAYTEYEKVLKNASSSTGDVALAKAKLDTTLANVNQSLNAHVRAQGQAERATSDATKATQRQITEAEKAARAAEAQATRSEQSSKRQEAMIIRTGVQMDELKKKIKDSGAPIGLLGSASKAFKDLERALTRAGDSAGDRALAFAKFDRTINNVNTRLKEHIRTQTDASKAATDAERAAQRQAIENERAAKAAETNAARLKNATAQNVAALINAEAKVDALAEAISSTGADTSMIDTLKQSYADLENVLTRVGVSTGEVAVAKATFSKSLGEVNRQLSTHVRTQNDVEKANREVEKAQKATNKELDRLGTTAQKNSDKLQQAMTRNEAKLLGAKDKVEQLLESIEKSGGDSTLVNKAVDAFQEYEKVLKSTSATSADVTLAQKRFEVATAAVGREVKNLSTAQTLIDKNSRQSESAMIRQENAVERLRIKVLDLQNALKLQGAKSERIDDLTTAFAEFETQMTSGVLSARQVSEATNKMNADLARIRRNEGITDLSSRMTDLAKAAQVALGPLSGVAARITAITSLANRNTIAFAGFIGGVIAFGTAMYKATLTGAMYEQQMHRIESILKVTGNRIGMTAGEIDGMARRVGQLTMTSQTMARNAASTLLLVRGVTKEMFEDVLLAAQGLSVLTEGNIESQIRRFARILESPAENIEALAESGIVFNAVEKERIRLLQMSGRMEEARAAVMERVLPVIEAAKGEAQGLSGAWDSLVETWTDFVVTSSTSSGVLDTVAAIIRDITSHVQNWNDSTRAAIVLGKGYRVVADALGFAINLVLENIDKLLVAMGLFIGLKFAAIIWDMVKGLVYLNRVLRGTVLLTGAATGGLKGLAIAVAAVAGIELYDYFDESSNAAIDLNNHLVDMSSSLRLLQMRVDAAKKGGGISGLDPEELADTEDAIQRVEKSMKLISQKINDANVQGIVPDVDMSVLEQANEALILDNVEEAAQILEKYLGTVNSVGAAMSQHQKDLEKAGNAYIELKNQHLSLINEQENMEAQLYNLESQFDLMVEVLEELGYTTKEAEAWLSRLRTEIILNNSSIERFLNSQRQSIAIMEMDAKITRAVGAEKRRLGVEQRVLQALWQSGIVTASNYTEAIKEMRAAGKGAELDRIIQTAKALEAWEFRNTIEEMNRGLREQADLLRVEAELAGKSERDRSVALAQERQKVLMLNAKIEEGTALWNAQLEAVRRIAELELFKDHAVAMKAMSDQFTMQEKVLDSLFYSEGTRERLIALAQKEIELASKYGSLMDERAQKELETFKLLQQRQKIVDEWKQIAGVVESAFDKLEDKIVEVIKTGEFNIAELGAAISEEMFRITLRMTILDPLQDMLGNMLSGLSGTSLGLGELGGSTIPIPLPVTIVGGLGDMLNSAVEPLTAPVTEVTRSALPDIGETTKAISDANERIATELVGKIRSLPVSPEFMQKLETALSRTGEDIGAIITSAGQAPLGSGGPRIGSTRHDINPATGMSDTADIVLTRNGQKVLPMEDPQLYEDFLQNSGAAGFKGIGHYEWGAHVGGGSQAAWGPDTTSSSLDQGFSEAIKKGWQGEFTSSTPLQTSPDISMAEPKVPTDMQSRAFTDFAGVPKVPEVKVPEIPAPEVPQMEVPMPEVPEVKVPDIPAPEVPQMEVPTPEVPEVYMPKAPTDLTAGKMFPPGMEVPSLQQPDIMNAPGMFAPPTAPQTFMPQPGMMPPTGFTQPQLPPVNLPQVPGGGTIPADIIGGGMPNMSGLNESVTQVTESMNSLSTKVPEVTSSLTAGFEQATAATETLATTGVDQATSSLQQMTTQGIQQNIAATVQSTASTQTMGTTSTVTAAQVQALGAAAASAAAQMQVAGVAGAVGGIPIFHEGGIVGENKDTMDALFNPKWNEQLILAKKGEEVLTGDNPRHINNFDGLLPKTLSMENAGYDQSTMRDIMVGGQIDQQNMFQDLIRQAAKISRQGKGLGGIQVHLHGVKDFDSFGRSKSQLNAGLASAVRQASYRQD